MIINLINLLILFLPTQLGKHFWPKFSFIHGRRIDYLAPKIYFIDLIIFFILIFFILKKSAKISTQLKKTIQNQIFLIIFLAIFISINIFFSSRPLLSFLTWLRWLEMVGLFFVIKSSFFGFKRTNYFLAVAIIYSNLIALLQWFRQSSLNGWFYWLGERQLSLSFPKISREVFSGQLVLPVYATFSHPNSLAGFLLLAVIISLFFNQRNKHKLIFLVSIFSLPILVLTFSYTSYLSLVVVCLYLLMINLFKKTSTKKIFSWIIFVSLLGLNFIQSFVFLLIPGQEPSIRRRLILNQFAFQAFQQRPIFGWGLNNFIPFLAHLKNFNLYMWLQPVHNIFLLILAEGGLILFGLILALLTSSYRKTLNKKDWFLTGGLLIVLTTGMFDHYWLTLIQNQLLVIILLSLIWRKLD